MSDFVGPSLRKGSGLNRALDLGQPIFGLVLGGVAPVGPPVAYALGQVVLLGAPSDADAYGLTAAYDAANSVRVRHHIERFFGYAPNSLLAVMVVAQSNTLAAMANGAGSPLEQLLLSEVTDRRCFNVGLVRNPEDPGEYTPTYTNGLDADAILAAQRGSALMAGLVEQGIYCESVLVEARLAWALRNTNYTGVHNNRGLAAEYAMMVTLADPAVQALDATMVNYAEVGAVLGMTAVRQVAECLGSVRVENPPAAFAGQESYPLTRADKGWFASCSLSNGESFYTLTEADKTALRQKGYIYGGKYEGYPGFYLNDSHTCTSASSDYAYQEDNRVWATAARIVRRALLPQMKGRFRTEGGALTPSAAAYLQGLAENRLAQQMANQLSGWRVLVSGPDFASTGGVGLEVRYERDGILRTLTGTVNAVTNLNA